MKACMYLCMCQCIHKLTLLHPLLFPRVRGQVAHAGFSHLLEDIYRPFHNIQYTIPDTLSKNGPLVKQDYLELAIKYSILHIFETNSLQLKFAHFRHAIVRKHELANLINIFN